MKKHVAGLTALMMMLGGMTVLPAAGEDFDAESAYREILDMYAHHLSTEWKDYIYKDGLYSNQIGGMDNPEIVGDGWKYHHTYDSGYRFFDLNGDGVEELLLGTYNDSDVTRCITDVYTYHDGQVVHLMTQMDDTPYRHISSEGNIVYNPNANQHSDAPIGDILYKIENGELQPFQAFLFDGSGHYFTEDPELLANGGWGILDNHNWNGWTPVSGTWYGEKMEESRSQYIFPRLDSFVHYQIESEKAETPDAPVVPIQGKSGYNALLRNYYHCIETQNFPEGDDPCYGTLFLTPNVYSYLWNMMCYQNQISLNETGYALHDINGDGIDELAVGTVNEDGSLTLFDLYTIYDGEIIHLAASGERDRFSIGTQGEVVEAGSSSAFHSSFTCYSIVDGMIIIADVFEFYEDAYYHLEHAGTNAESWKTVTEEEFNAGIASHETLVLNAVPFTAFSEESDMLGDLNGDIEINATDAMLLLIAAAKLGAGEESGLTDAQITAADTNGDGEVNAADANDILRYAAYDGAGGTDSIEEFLSSGQ